MCVVCCANRICDRFSSISFWWHSIFCVCCVKTSIQKIIAVCSRQALFHSSATPAVPFFVCDYSSPPLCSLLIHNHIACLPLLASSLTRLHACNIHRFISKPRTKQQSWNEKKSNEDTDRPRRKIKSVRKKRILENTWSNTLHICII